MIALLNLTTYQWLYQQDYCFPWLSLSRHTAFVKVYMFSHQDFNSIFRRAASTDRYSARVLMHVCFRFLCPSTSRNINYLKWAATYSTQSSSTLACAHFRKFDLQCKNADTVATSQLALHWMCDSPRTGCVRRITPKYMWREQAITEWSRTVACCHRVKLCALAARLTDWNNTFTCESQVAEIASFRSFTSLHI